MLHVIIVGLKVFKILKLASSLLETDLRVFIANGAHTGNPNPMLFLDFDTDGIPGSKTYILCSKPMALIIDDESFFISEDDFTHITCSYTQIMKSTMREGITKIKWKLIHHARGDIDTITRSFRDEVPSKVEQWMEDEPEKECCIM
jgi:tyrosine-protein phosphatase YwqE